jgi:hypothetical protein
MEFLGILWKFLNYYRLLYVLLALSNQLLRVRVHFVNQGGHCVRRMVGHHAVAQVGDVVLRAKLIQHGARMRPQRGFRTKQNARLQITLQRDAI